MTLSRESNRVDAVTHLPLPGWLYELIDEETKRFRAKISEEWADGDFFVPFKSVRVIGEELWLVPAPSARLLAVSVPAGRDSGHVVLPRGDEIDGLLDVAVLGDRLVALYSTELRVYELERASPDRFELWR